MRRGLSEKAIEQLLMQDTSSSDEENVDNGCTPVKVTSDNESVDNSCMLVDNSDDIRRKYQEELEKFWPYARSKSTCATDVEDRKEAKKSPRGAEKNRVGKRRIKVRRWRKRGRNGCSKVKTVADHLLTIIPVCRTNYDKNTTIYWPFMVEEYFKIRYVHKYPATVSSLRDLISPNEAIKEEEMVQLRRAETEVDIVTQLCRLIIDYASKDKRLDHR